MPRYRAVANYSTSYEVYFDAEDEDEAYEIAEDCSLTECDQDGKPWKDIGLQSYELEFIQEITPNGETKYV